MSLDLSVLSAPAVIALVVLVVVQVTLAVISFVALVRTPRERFVFERKWPWALIVVLVNVIGPIAFLAVGRRAAPVDVSQSAERRGDSVAHVVENLYGDDRG